MTAKCFKCRKIGVVGGPVSNGWTFCSVRFVDEEDKVMVKILPLCPDCTAQSGRTFAARTTCNSRKFTAAHPYVED